MPSNDLKNIYYAPWLEQALQELILFPVKGICMFAVGEDGAMMDALHANEAEEDE